MHFLQVMTPLQEARTYLEAQPHGMDSFDLAVLLYKEHGQALVAAGDLEPFPPELETAFSGTGTSRGLQFLATLDCCAQLQVSHVTLPTRVLWLEG